MIILRIIIFIILLDELSVNVNGDSEIICTEEYCTAFINDKGCPQLNTNCLSMNATHHGIYLKYPDICNCCEYCLSNLGPGDICMRGYPGSQLSVSVCGHGLACTVNPSNDSSTCQRLKTNCHRDEDDWYKRRQDGNLGMTEVRPKCDNDGEYAPIHCIPGSICYCISPNGERIFGEMPYLNLWDEQLMTCGCGLNDWKMRNTLDYDRWNDKNLSGIFSARCTAIGHYDPLQCMLGDNATCFCVDPVTGRPNKSILDVVDMKNIREGQPSCFNLSIHKPGTYDTPCETLRRMTMSSNNLLSDYYSFDNVICQPDGMFHRLQTLTSRRVCVDPLGKQITHNEINYEANIKTKAAKIMDCNCARNIWLLLSSGVTVELPKCCSNGNFQSWQCRRNICYCIDNNGNQIGLEVNNEDISKLSCYNDGQPCPI